MSADLEEDVISRIFRIYNTARVGVGVTATGSGWSHRERVGIVKEKNEWVELEGVAGWSHSKYVDGINKSEQEVIGNDGNDGNPL